ncbi:MAG: RNA-binding protein [Thermoplasmata archaeon]|nr:RNA-binding protein [Thermoplasmata archaeon]
MNIYIGNISYDVSEDDLKHAFEEYGQVASVKIITDRYSGRSKGFGFAEMPDDEEGQAAISGLDGGEFMGRQLKVNVARPRREDSQRS